MKYFLVNDNYIEYNEETHRAEVFDPKEVEVRLRSARERLEAIPKDLSDSELLEWAKLNYPKMDYSAEVSELKRIIEDCETKLTGIKGL